MIKRVTRTTECEDCGEFIPAGGFIFAYGNDYYCPRCAEKYGETPQTFAERHFALRRANELTMPMMSQQSGISYNSFSLYERHDALPNSYNLKVIATLLGTTADYLIGLSDDPNRRDL